MAVTQRADRSRELIAGALLELVREGVIAPTAPEVAARAGVSLRLVFHHFRDMEAVWELAGKRQLARFKELTKPIPCEGAFEGRLAALMAGRARLYEEIAPVRRAALLKEPFSAALAASLAEARAAKRAETERLFAPELATFPPAEREDVAAAVAAAASWSSWNELRAHQRLGVARTRRIVARTIQGLLQGGSR